MRVKIYLVFLFCLFIPFLIRGYHYGLEVYPSIVLPPGASKIDLNEEFVTFNREVALIEPEKGESKVNIIDSDILNDIPRHYITTLIKNKFGVDDVSRNRITNQIKNKFGIDTIRDKNNKFLKERLEKSGYKNEEIVLKTIRTIYHKRTGEITEDVIAHEFLKL